MLPAHREQSSASLQAFDDLWSRFPSHVEDVRHQRQLRGDGLKLLGDLLWHIHGRIFGELYEWAGRWRTVQISKPGAIWPPPHYLDESMQAFEDNVLTKYPAVVLTDDNAYCTALGEIQGEFLAIHPFREGNARTMKLMTDLLSVQTGRPLLIYDMSEEGESRYTEAAKTALLAKDYQPMVQVIRLALDAARKEP